MAHCCFTSDRNAIVFGLFEATDDGKSSKTITVYTYSITAVDCKTTTVYGLSCAGRQKRSCVRASCRIDGKFHTNRLKSRQHSITVVRHFF